MMNPYYEQDGITLYLGDCREIVPVLQGRFDAVMADPPYNETNLAWDVWPEGWVKVMAGCTNQLWCFGSMAMFWEFRAEFDGWKLAQDIVWEKHNGSSLLADRFRRVHENAVHLYRGRWRNIPKTPPVVTIEHERKRQSVIRSKKPQHWGEISEDAVSQGGAYEYDGTRLMRSVIPVRSCHGHAVNETQKPEGIVEPLLRYSVPAGGSVLVPFAGSGTDLAVARRLGLRAVGIEKRECQCREIVKRLSQGEMIL
ncbi:MAG TPA: site-specific DNA-methyltransferase [Prosthecobacter sp.]